MVGYQNTERMSPGNKFLSHVKFLICINNELNRLRQPEHGCDFVIGLFILLYSDKYIYQLLLLISLRLTCNWTSFYWWQYCQKSVDKIFSFFSNQGSSDYANYYQGLWDCEAEGPDELAFQRGDLIYILSKVCVCFLTSLA